MNARLKVPDGGSDGLKVGLYKSMAIVSKVISVHCPDIKPKSMSNWKGALSGKGDLTMRDFNIEFMRLRIRRMRDS